MRLPDERVTSCKKNAEAADSNAFCNAAIGRNTSLIAIFAGVAAIAVVDIRLLRSIKSSLGLIQSMVVRIDNGLDLTTRATVNRQDEIGQTDQGSNRLLD